MYERKVVLPLTEDEWRTLCVNAKSMDRTPKLQARYMLRMALGLVPHSDPGQAKNESGATVTSPAAAL